MERGGCVYIVTNKNDTVLYIGVTSDLYSRIKEHKDKYHKHSFSAKYNCNKLVFYEQFSTIEEAIARERQLKNWRRQWKLDLIDAFNPARQDLFNEDL